ncbi:MAG TPA: hypothetical protein VM582_02465 [Candidatus Thermoplasmatota archaeon]|nr:hypothetical protein [Candidatus Thermoplasmatota archaeon]
MRLLALALVGSLAAAGCVQLPAATDAHAEATALGLLLPLPARISGLEAVSNVEFGAANDLAFHGDLVFVATHNNGMHVIDVSDPQAPVEVAVVECNGKDIDVRPIAGRVIVTISSQSDDKCPDAAPRGGIRLVDVTDPRAPVVLSQVPLKYGSHTHTPYGDTGLIYNSAYNLAGDLLASPKDHSRSEIVNIRDPLAPFVEAEFLFPATSSSIGCHDILAEPERDRAICGAISETMIWDTTDPLAPKVVSTIVNPLLNIHHSAATARDGTLLALGDEWAGVLAPACHPAGQTPTGAIWFYDISDPTDPKELGYVPPPAGDARTVCTAHNFNFVDDDFLVAGFYSAGTLLIDVTDPAKPKVAAQLTQSPTSSWASYYYRGAVFSGDGVRGLDIYRLV